jgi:hypothetical protein
VALNQGHAMSSKSSKPAPVEWASDRMKMLAPLITPRVMELAYLRMQGVRFIAGKGVKAIAVEDEQWVLKMALIVVLEMWPHQRFGVEEEALMRGMDADNVNPYKKEGLIRSF